MSLSVLFIGGTGVISSACVDAAVRAGMDVTTINRGTSTARPVPDAVESLRADIRDADAVRRFLGGRHFDAVGFPVTIVRPSHTYVPTHVPLMSGWTDVDRMRCGAEVGCTATAHRSGRCKAIRA